jgi:PBP1b-binding outer membrane lipoprotein LpoB
MMKTKLVLSALFAALVLSACGGGSEPAAPAADTAAPAADAAAPAADAAAAPAADAAAAPAEPPKQ